MTNVPVWRTAINDSSHSLHNFAWALFREKFNPARAARRFADQREAIEPFLYAVIDDKRLYAEKSSRRGYALPHAISLLGQWQVVEAVPRLIAILEEADDLDIVSDRAAGALEQMPAETIKLFL